MTMTTARSFEEMFAYALILLAALSGLNAAGISIHKHGDQDDQSTANFQYHEDAYLNARELITKYGYRGETHRVKTKDGYILEVHRITGPKSNPRPEGKPVVFLMHGLLASSDDWLISGPEKAYAYMLADSGYDVWLGNARGNHYCRKHVRHSVLDKQFWMFSWHEIGIDDLPSMIDYVIEKTGSEKIFYAGHSQGTTSFFVMASERPEYNDKIKAMFAMAPVTYMQYMSSPFLRVLSQFGEVASTALTALGTYEFKPTDEFLNHVKSTVCDEDAWTQPMCENIIFLLAGYGTDQMNKTLLPAILGHVPAGSSARQIFHYAQLIRSHEFRQYDHGFFGNIANYKRSTPPSYDLSKVTVPVVLHYSVNDCFSHVKDVQRLESKLPNIYAKLKVPNPRFAHLDYTWGIDAHRLLYSKSILLMDRLEKQL